MKQRNAAKITFKINNVSKKWIHYCNNGLLFLVTFTCVLVIFEISVLDQKFITILDSSLVAQDIVSVNLIDSIKSPFWKNIADGISVYSAFYEIQNVEQNPNYVLIIGSSTSDKIETDKLRCLIKYGNDAEDISIGDVLYEKLLGSSTVFFYCSVRNNDIPKKVALISYANSISKQLMEIETFFSRMEMDLIQPKVAACVEPITSDTPVKQIIRFIEFYERIGVSHFYFYHHNISSEVLNVLQEMGNDDCSIRTLPWKKRYSKSGSIPWSEHVQDCVHRSINKFSDLLTVGVYDFLDLKHFTGLPALLSIRHERMPPNVRLKFTKACPGEDNKQKHLVTMSETNFVLKPRATSAIKSNKSIADKIRKTTFRSLSDGEGIVNSYGKDCQLE